MTNDKLKKHLLNIISGCLGDHMNIHSSYLMKEGLTVEELVKIVNDLNKLLMTFRKTMTTIADEIE